DGAVPRNWVQCCTTRWTPPSRTTSAVTRSAVAIATRWVTPPSTSFRNRCNASYSGFGNCAQRNPYMVTSAHLPFGYARRPKRETPLSLVHENGVSLPCETTARLQDERLCVRPSLTCTCSRRSRKRKW